MPGQNIWTFHNNPPPNDQTGNDLNGCHIVQTATGYNFTAPNINNVLASSTNLTFTNVPYASMGWDISVNSPLTPGANGSGSWLLAQIPTGRPMPDPSESGTFTAQAGQQMDADAEAASAKA